MYEAGKYVKVGQKSMTRDGIRKGREYAKGEKKKKEKKERYMCLLTLIIEPFFQVSKLS